MPGQRLGDVDVSKYLGSGMAKTAAKTVKKRKKRVKRDLNNVMDQLSSGRRKK